MVIWRTDRSKYDALFQNASDTPPAFLHISLEPSSEHQVGVALDEQLSRV
jgi:hypothetical protein